MENSKALTREEKIKEIIQKIEKLIEYAQNEKQQKQ